ncbi:MAG: hypothetical protein PHX89_05255, partial [bacterium]|nr:hypothetical protein [bacterium]
LPDPLGHQAGSFAGAVSILIGIAANKSIKEGRNIRINDLVPLDKYRKDHVIAQPGKPENRQSRT